MVNLNTWCPFERLIAVLKKTGIRVGCKQVSFDFGEFGSRSYNLETDEGKLYYFNGGFSLKSRLDWLAKPERSFVVKFDETAFDVVVKHDLFKRAEFLPEFKGKKPVNNKVGVSPSFFREALEIENTTRKNLTLAGQQKPAVDDFVPFYHYVIFNHGMKEGEIIEIHGPGFQRIMNNVGVYSSPNGDIEIFSNAGEVSPDFYDEPEAPVIDEKILKMKQLLFVEYNNVKLPVTVGPVNVLGGIKLHGATLLKLYKLAVYLEFCAIHNIDSGLNLDEDGTFTVHLNRAGNSLLLPYDIEIMFNERVLTNAFVNDLFKDFQADVNIELRVIHSPNGTINDPGIYAPIVSIAEKKQTSFILTAAAYLSQVVDGSVTSFIGAVNSMNETGGVVVAYDKTLNGYAIVGRSDVFYDGEKRRVVSASGYATVVGQLQRVNDVSGAEDGFVIVGFDGESNIFTNQADHYFLCYKSGSKLILVYDPDLYMSNNALNRDIRYSFESANPDERVIYHVHDGKVFSWARSGDAGVIG